MAIAITNYSEQGTKQSNIASTYFELKTTELHGRRRIAWFYYKPTAAVAANAVIGMIKLPKGARIVLGKLLSNALVATSTADVGLVGADGSGFIDAAGTVADNSGLFASALAVATAGAYEFASTIAQNSGYVTEKEVYLVVKLNTAGMDGSADILQGDVSYVVD